MQQNCELSGLTILEIFGEEVLIENLSYLDLNGTERIFFLECARAYQTFSL